MIKDVRIFAGQRMNFDDHETKLAPSETREVRNVRFDSSYSSNIGVGEIIKGPKKVLYGVPYATKIIGACTNKKDRKIVVFIYSETGKHSIVYFDPDTDTYQYILKEKSYLNFQPDHPILDADVVDDMLFWTDGYDGDYLTGDSNPPRKLSITRALRFYESGWATTGWAMYEDLDWDGGIDAGAMTVYGGEVYECIKDIEGGLGPIPPFGASNSDEYWLLREDMDISKMYLRMDAEDITRIKKPPARPPRSFTGDSSGISFNDGFGTDWSRLANNHLKKIYQFRYRYIYQDNEKSTWSGISKQFISPTLETVEGDASVISPDDVKVNNVICFSLESGSFDVKTVEIAARASDTNVWKLVDRIHKFRSAGQYSGSNTGVFGSVSTVEILFYGDSIGEPLDQIDIERPFDYVPQVSDHQEVLSGNIVLDVGVTEGYPNTEVDLRLSKITMPSDFDPNTSQKNVYPDGFIENASSVHSWYDPPPNTFAQPFFDHHIENSCGGASGSEDVIVVLDKLDLNAAGPVIVGAVYYIRFMVYIQKYTEPKLFPANDTGTLEKKAEKEITASYYVNEGDSINDVRDGLIAAINAQVLYEKELRFTVAMANPPDNPSPIPALDGVIYFVSGKTIEPIPASQVECNDSYYWPVIGVSDGDYLSDHIPRIFNAYAFFPYDHKRTTKSGCTYTAGIVYHDDANRSGFVNGVKSFYMPTKQSLYGGQLMAPYPLDHLQYEIHNTPPEWATHYNFVLAKNDLEYYLQIPVKRSMILSDNTIASQRRVHIYLNEFIKVKEKAFPDNTLEQYVWQRGDRIRAVAIKKLYNPDNPYNPPPGALPSETTMTWLHYNKFFDAEIIGLEYPDTTQSDYGFLTDGSIGDDRYILDADGNKIKDPSQQRLIVNLPPTNEDIDDWFTSSASGENETIIIFEIYRIRKRLGDEDSEVFYEVGETYEIYTQGGQRYHRGGTQDQTDIQPAIGVFQGDSFAYYRIGGKFEPITDPASEIPYTAIESLFGGLIESMQYSDYFKSDVSDFGRRNVVDVNAVRQHYPTKARHSRKYLEETELNGLCSFDYDAIYIFPVDYGQVHAAHQKGDTLKIIQTSRVSSSYIGTAVLRTKDGGELMADTSAIFGGYRPSEDQWGCKHPESVFTIGRHTYFYDEDNAAIVRDAPNGMIPISTNYKAAKELKRLRDLFMDAGPYDVIMGYDPSHEELYITFALKTPNVNIPPETIVFQESPGTGFKYFIDLRDLIGIAPYAYVSSGKQLFIAYKDELWAAGQGDRYASFFGIDYDAIVTIVSNAYPEKVKVFGAIAIQSNVRWGAPNFGDVSILPSETYPDGMSSLIKSEAFVAREGEFYASFLRNAKTQSGVPSISDLVNGDALRGKSIQIRLSSTEHDSGGTMNMVIINSDPSEMSG